MKSEKGNLFQQQWALKVRRIHQSSFYRKVSSPPSDRIESDRSHPSAHEVAIDRSWILATCGDLRSDGPTTIGLNDLRQLVESNFGVCLRSRAVSADAPAIIFELCPPARPTSRWDRAFYLNASPGRIQVRAGSEEALLRASLYLTNYWRLRRNLFLPIGRRQIRPAIPVHIGADLWGGFSTTQAWIPGRENETNFLELARVGINVMPIMVLLEDTISSASPAAFRCLINPRAKAYRQRLARLARQAARYDVAIMLMGYNPKLAPDHPVFRRYPACRGALQCDGAFRVLCSSDPMTRKFLAGAWASLFRDIPELGGLMAIIGGEGFYHCYMRSFDPERNKPYPILPVNTARDCPRCSRRSADEVVAELTNTVAQQIHTQQPEALVVTWPYGAGVYWSPDRDQERFIRKLDSKHVIFQAEVDKDYMEWRPAGYAKMNWDYSLSSIALSHRCKAQRLLCRRKNLPFSVKLQSNVAIECLNVPYLPILENQRIRWEQCRALKPVAMQSRWLFDFSSKAPPEELGYWISWGDRTEFSDLDRVLDAIASRDYGPAAAPVIRKTWRIFSEAMRHHPCLAYYIGSYFIGPAQPLVLDPYNLSRLDQAFFGLFYWEWENTATNDDTLFVKKQPLFFSRPGFKAIARRGPNKGHDVALDELQTLARLWQHGMTVLAKARPLLSAGARNNFRDLWILSQHLAYTWQSAANVEEFLRLRDLIRGDHGPLKYQISDQAQVNRRDLDRMEQIARQELKIAQADLVLTRNVDALDLSMRLDMGVVSTQKILSAKIRQVKSLLQRELPAWRKELMCY